MILSILIPSIPEHTKKLEGLLKQLKKQDLSNVQILTYETEASKNGGMSIGSKRTKLINQAKGEYSVFIDSDDVISEDYIANVLQGIKSGADVICFQVKYRKDKTGFEKIVKYSKDFKRDGEKPEYYERLPNHLMVVKTSIAKVVGWKDMTYGEDAEYSKRLKPFLKSEYQINKLLYYYIDTK
ncbi:MAG: glycosyltransferase [Psychroserpens sp.]|nr:glycosyltransferase [Psychroserpens sp.]